MTNYNNVNYIIQLQKDIKKLENRIKEFEKQLNQKFNSLPYYLTNLDEPKLSSFDDWLVDNNSRKQ